MLFDLERETPDKMPFFSFGASSDGGEQYGLLAAHPMMEGSSMESWEGQSSRMILHWRILPSSDSSSINVTYGIGSRSRERRSLASRFVAAMVESNNYDRR